MPVRRAVLPREGFKADAIIQLVRLTALNPAFLLPFLLLVRYTNKGEKWAILHPTAFRRIKVLFYWAMLKMASQWYGDKVLNNWVTDRAWDLKREVAVVTGGCGGIGGILVRLLAERGVRVAVLDIQDMTFEGGPMVSHYKCDITSSSQIAASASQIRAKWGDPTILVNNAGVARGKTILDSTERDNRFTFDVNTISHYILAREFVPAMVKRDHGMIVTVASYASFLTVPNMVDYAASKAAALAFHEGLAAELKTRHKAPRVRTVVINQGYTKTPLFSGFQNDNGFLSPSLEPETVAEAIAAQIFTGRSGQVIIPRFGAILAALKAMPHWHQASLRASGQNIMTHWHGRQVVKDLDKFFDAKETAEVAESGVLVAEKLPVQTVD